MNKKIFILTLSLVFLVAIGAVLYLLFLAPDNTSPSDSLASVEEAEPGAGASGLPGPENSNPLEQTPALPEETVLVTPNKKLVALSESSATGFAVKSFTEIIYFNKDLGQFVTASLSGKNVQPASSNTFTSVAKIVWSPDKSEAIMTFGSGLSYYYNLTDGFSQQLPKEARDFSWSPDGDKIVYEVGDEPTASQIIMSNPDGSNQTKVKDLGYTSRIAGWSSLPGGPISLVQVYDLGAGRSVYPVYANGASGQALKFDGYGSRAKYSRDGKRLLYPVIDTKEFKQTLWVVDTDGLNRYSLGVQTFVEKCVWGSESIFVYCAVPSQALGVEPKLDDPTIDNFWKINTKTGAKTKLYDESMSNVKVDAENVWTSPTEDRLYFENVKDGKIYILYISN